MKLKSMVAVFAAATIGVLGYAGTAQATEANEKLPTAAWALRDWNADGSNGPSTESEIVSPTGVALVRNDGTKGTSIETPNLGFAVKSGDKVTVDYVLEGGSTAAGAIRLFIYDKPNGNTLTEAPKQFVWAETVEGKLAITVNFDGTIGTAGLTYDASNAIVPGGVLFQNLKVNDTLVLFEARPVTPPPSETPSAPKDCEAYKYTGTNENLCATFPNATEATCADVQYRVTLVNVENDPWGLDSDSGGTPGVGCESNPVKPATSSTTNPAAAGGLPVTGVNSKTIAVAGAGALVLGVVAILLGRKRRVRTETE